MPETGSTIRHLIQKKGDKLANTRPTREETIKDVNSMTRDSVTRNWGDQKNDPSKKK